jgi:hypothetical protein
LAFLKILPVNNKVIIFKKNEAEMNENEMTPHAPILNRRSFVKIAAAAAAAAGVMAGAKFAVAS